MSWLYVFLTIALTVYGQIIIKWQMSHVSDLPHTVIQKSIFIASLLFNPWIISVFIAAAIAAFSWMIAMTKLKLSIAYPWVSLTFPCVLIASAIFFKEPLTFSKVIGICLIMFGLIITTSGIRS